MVNKMNCVPVLMEVTFYWENHNEQVFRNTDYEGFEEDIWGCGKWKLQRWWSGRVFLGK